MKWCFISVRQLAQQFKRTWRKLRFHESRFAINGGGVEPQVSAALVQNTVERFAPIIDELYATLPPPLEGYRVKSLMAITSWRPNIGVLLRSGTVAQRRCGSGLIPRDADRQQGAQTAKESGKEGTT